VILDDHEREKFIAYCRRNAESSKAMLKQFELLPMGQISELVERQRLKAVAYEIVANDLASTESQSIG